MTPHEARLPLRAALPAVLLVCAWPMLNFMTHNAGHQLDIALLVSVLLPIYMFVTSLAVLGYLLLATVLGRYRHGVAAWVITTVIAFHIYSISLPAIEKAFRTVGLTFAPHYGYGAFFIVAPLLAAALFKSNRRLRFVTVFVYVMTGVAAAELVWVRHSLTPLADEVVDRTYSRKAVDAAPAKTRDGPLPNVYQIVVDEYARHDRLRNQLGFDNQPFLRTLERRGFVVARNGGANYPWTSYSLPATLEMDYPITPEQPRLQVKKVVGNVNNAVGAYRARGYSYGHVGSNRLGATQCADHPAVNCLTPRTTPISTERLEVADAYLRMTPISYFVHLLVDTNNTTTVDDVREVASAMSLPQPFFLFAHTLAPHSPYNYGADCSPNAKVQFHLSGGLDAEKYLGALQCVNLRLLRFVDFIHKSDPEAIVLLHSDHGTKFLLDELQPVDAWTGEQFRERHSILLAVRFPPRCRASVPQNLTLVNLHRLTLACVDNVAPVLLENRFFNVPFGKTHAHGKIPVHQYPGSL